MSEAPPLPSLHGVCCSLSFIVWFITIICHMAHDVPIHVVDVTIVAPSFALIALAIEGAQLFNARFILLYTLFFDVLSILRQTQKKSYFCLSVATTFGIYAMSRSNLQGNSLFSELFSETLLLILIPTMLWVNSQHKADTTPLQTHPRPRTNNAVEDFVQRCAH